MDYNTLKTELEPFVSNCNKYAPVVAVCLLLLIQVAAAGFLVTQPVAEDQSGTAVAQSGDISEGVYFAASRGGTIKKYDSEGNELWSTNPSGVSDPFGSMDYDYERDIVYVSHLNGGTVALDGETGDKLWESPGGSGVETYSGADVVVAIDFSGTAYGLDPETGNEIWSNQVHNDDTLGLDLTTEYAYTGSVDDTVNRIYPSNGTIAETYTFSGNINSINVYSDGEYAIVGRDSDTAILNLQNGNVGPSQSFGGTVYVTGTDFEGEGGYAGSLGGPTRAYSDRGLTEVWDNNRGDVHGLDVGQNNDTIITGGGGNARVIDKETGDLVWEDTSFSGDVWGVWAGDPEITLTTEFDPELEIDTRNYIKHGNTAGYEVYYTNPDTGETQLVNNESGLSLNSSNTSVFTVNTAEERLEATNDTSINQREQFTATYEGLEAQENVTVANATVENLPILPGITRVGATYSDSNIVLILVGTLLGVVATRISTAFAGIGTIQLTLVAGFFVDLVSLGVVLVGLFAALFIGLNLAANIDYAVSR